MTDKTIVVIQNAENVQAVPGLSAFADAAEIRCVPVPGELRAALAGAEVLLGWNFAPGKPLAEAWEGAGGLRWIHRAGVGVDTWAFPQLIDSDVVVTNSRGAFDRPMAEYVLGLIIAMAKGFPETLARQAEHRWHSRRLEPLEGRVVLVIGAGSIGSAVGRLAKDVGLEVAGVARTPRASDPVFGKVHGFEALDRLLPRADFVVHVAPLTPQTRRSFGRAQLRAMKRTARFINIGRGPVVDEAALVEALRGGDIAGAALDVFETEPLPESSPLWDMPNVIVSPHISGELPDLEESLAKAFLENLRRYLASEPLLNVVDIRRGY